MDRDSHDAHPNFSRLYRYRPLDPELDEIRLLQLKKGTDGDHITCEVVHTSIGGAEFKALSYTWGDTTSIHWINLDGCFVPCTSNLHAALLSLRSATEDLTLWVDALCIDQQNLEEQSQQVQKMKRIYRQAAKVLIWLGSADSDTRSALALVVDLNDHCEDLGWIESKIKDPNSLEPFYALCRLFNHDYWHRVWVVQEIESARSVMVHCGSDTIEWQVLVNVQTMLNKNYDELLASKFNRHPAMRGYIAWWGPQALRPTHGNDGPVSPDLFQLLLKHCAKLATNPRDKIYALVGISSARSTFPIDYSSSVRKVYTNLVYSLVGSSQTLDIICVLHNSGSNMYQLPSWAPDWSVKDAYVEDFFNPYNMATYKVSAAGQTKADAKFTEDGILSARGRCVDTVRHLGKRCEARTVDDFDATLEAFHDWWALWKSLQGTSDLSQEAFVRTLLCNRVGPHHLNEHFPSHKELLQWLLGAFATISLRSRPDVALDATLLALTDGHDWNDFEQVKSMDMQWISTIAACMLGRRLFVSSSGIPGLGPSLAEEGDKICLLFGCSVPVILRPVEGYHILVGAAYVDGLMTGTATVDIKTQEFEIR